MKYELIYIAISDGVNSGVTATKLPANEANELLELNPDVYFKTFTDAKRKVLVHVTEAYNQWLAIVKRVRAITKTSSLKNIQDRKSVV